LGLFRKSRFLDADVEDWALETWTWLMREFGGMAQIRWTRVVLPTREFFPPAPAEGAARASYLFQRVKGLMRMDDWPCELETLDRSETKLAHVGRYGVERSRGISGRFESVGGRVVVSYDPDLTTDPVSLIAVLAHELSHYRLSRARTPAPGDVALKELVTELAVAFAGFGVFSANVAFNFKASLGGRYGGSWSAETSGYLSESTWAFAIALLSALKDQDPPLPHLKTEVADLTKDAAHYLKHNDALLAPLRAIA
jgi:hypothetical protein